MGTPAANVCIGAVLHIAYSWLLVFTLYCRYLHLSSFDHVAHALMALSACRLAWVSKSLEIDSIAHHYQTVALRLVQKDIQHLCTDNCDAILSTLILLSTEVDNRYAISSRTVKGY